MKFFTILLAIVLAEGSKLPEGTKLCHKSDPKFNDCMRDAITDAFGKIAGGVKQLGIPKLEPLPIEELSAESAGGLSQTYKNIKLYGLLKSKVTKFTMDWDKLTTESVVENPHSEMTADYSIKGQLLSFPIDSVGKCRMFFDDTVSTHKTKLERFQKDGKTYLRVVDWKLKIEPKKIRYQFDDIVPGNKLLSDTILQTLNENAIQIFMDQAPVFEEAYATIHKAYANKFYEKIPEDELYLP